MQGDIWVRDVGVTSTGYTIVALNKSTVLRLDGGQEGACTVLAEVAEAAFTCMACTDRSVTCAQ